MEAQFACNRITKDLTKNYHAWQSLHSDVVSELRELTMNPPRHSKYKALKSRVMSEFRDSDEKHLRGLLHQAEFEDQRPSHFLRRIRDFAKGKMSDDLLKSLWIQCLSTSMQTILATCGDKLDKLADGSHGR